MRQNALTFRFKWEPIAFYILLPMGGLLIVGWVGVLGYLLLFAPGRTLPPVGMAIFIGFLILLGITGFIVGFWRLSQALFKWPKRRLPWPLPV